METPRPNEPGEQVADFLRTHEGQILVIVFTDIEDSTAITESLGDQVAIPLIQKHHAAIREVLRRHRGGREVETAGDSFFLVFTTATDAVRFAVQAQAAMRELAAKEVFPLQIRIGIHQGELFVSSNSDGASPGRLSIQGGEKNTAARVMSLAAGGQILLSRTPYESARRGLHRQAIAGVNELEWRSCGPCKLRGVSEPMEICEVWERGFGPGPLPAATGPSPPPPPPLHATSRGPDDRVSIPEGFQQYVCPGTRLRLKPTEEDEREVRLVARPDFKLGRDDEEADYLTVFWPLNKKNRERSCTMSRVHVIFEREGARLTLRDQAKFAGALWNDEVLAQGEAMPFEAAGELQIGDGYRLEVFPITNAPQIRPPTIVNEGRWRGPAPPRKPPQIPGAVRFRPLETEPPPWDAVWVFTEATFGSSAANAVVLGHPEVEPEHGCFHYYRNCFWVRSAGPNATVLVNDEPCAPGHIIPLASYQMLQIGSCRYCVEIS